MKKKTLIITIGVAVAILCISSCQKKTTMTKITHKTLFI